MRQTTKTIEDLWSFYNVRTLNGKNF